MPDMPVGSSEWRDEHACAIDKLKAVSEGTPCNFDLLAHRKLQGNYKI